MQTYCLSGYKKHTNNIGSKKESGRKTSDINPNMNPNPN